MVWVTISAHLTTLLPPCYLLLATGTSELDKIHPLTQKSVPSNVIQDLFVKITSEKSISMYFLAQF